MTWTMAWRNVWRNPRRTLITATSIMLGVMLVSAMGGLGNGMTKRMVRNATDDLAGHAQIHAATYTDTKDETLVIEEYADVLEQARSLDDVTVATPRVLGFGILAIADRSRGVTLMGIDPKHEARTTTWDERVVEGAYLDAPGQVMLGKYLADKLDVELGSKMVLTAADVHTGEATTELVRVKALLHTGSVAVDRNTAIVHIEMAQKMMGLPDSAHEIVLRLGVDTRDPEVVHEAIAPLRRDGFDVEPWHEINKVVAELMKIMDVYIYIMTIVLFIILAFGIINTISMALLERMREFGVMRALGTSGAQLAKLVVTEAFYLGLVGAVPGILAGLGASWLLVVYGLDFSGTTAYGMEFKDPIYGEINIFATIFAAVVFTLLTAVVSLYAAWRASRVDPVEAMRG
ncbi:MAG: FtsX-like permease family protein [Myxococcota bacterium]